MNEIIKCSVCNTEVELHYNDQNQVLSESSHPCKKSKNIDNALKELERSFINGKDFKFIPKNESGHEGGSDHPQRNYGKDN